MADIIYLVERLEQVLSQGWRVPLTSNAMINEDAFIDIVEQMHIAIPNEIRQAQGIVQQKERILAQAREEAERIVAQAHQQAERLVGETDIAARARSRAAEIVAEAEQEADDVCAGADHYATEVLSRIRKELQVYLRQVDNGLERLQAPEPPAPPRIDLDDDGDEDDEPQAKKGANQQRVENANPT